MSFRSYVSRAKYDGCNKQSIFKNKFNGILTALGHGFGIGIYALFAVIGVGIVIETNILIFNSLKILSVIFYSTLVFKVL